MTGSDYVSVTAGQVQSLIRDQVPELGDLAVSMAGQGWDNATWRIGDRLAARLPRHGNGEQLLTIEQTWLPLLAPGLPLPVPTPSYSGVPGAGYPFRWSLVPWFDGESAADQRLDDVAATQLGQFLQALHLPAPPNAPINPFRSAAMADRRPQMDARLDLLGAHEVVVARELWLAGVAAPGVNLPTWIHADLHPRNLVLAGGHITAVIDWGDMSAGDPATDLAAAWMLFDEPDRARFREAYGTVDAPTWTRARAWAVYFGVMFRVTPTEKDSAAATLGARILRNSCS